MKINTLFIAMFIFINVTSVCTQAANLTFYTDEPNWVAAVSGSVETFDFTPPVIALADEVPNPPADDTSVGGFLTFDKTNTGLSWSFTLEANQPGAEFVWNDNPANSNFQGALSVGNVHEHEDDDFWVRITEGPSLYAFAFDLIENDDPCDQGHEFIQVFDKVGTFLGQHDIDVFPQSGFLGVVSDTSIGSVFFEEASIGDDDMCIDNLRFVPEPATILLLGLGALALLRKKKL